jgi:DUF2934 family protein
VDDDSGSMAPERSLKIGGNHGYRIDGDKVSLNADLAVVHEHERGHPKGWSLQLWACERPHQMGSLSGIKVAEVPVAMPSSPEAPMLRLEAEAFANIPPSRSEYSMVLVLASGGPGALEQVHDFANYPKRELFLLPRLEGTVGYSIEAGLVVLTVDRIDNQRPPGSLSGSLALELWALPEPYSGRALDGVVLARAEIGQIAGQCTLESLQCCVAFTPPPKGQWRLALVLREWTAASGFVSCDYCNFSVAYGSTNGDPQNAGASLTTQLEDETSAPESVSRGAAIGAPPSHDEIAAAAYYRYLARGPGPGDPLHDWLEAERELFRAAAMAQTSRRRRHIP